MHNRIEKVLYSKYAVIYPNVHSRWSRFWKQIHFVQMEDKQ